MEMKRYFLLFAVAVSVIGCCTKELCMGNAHFELTGFSKEELEKGFFYLGENEPRRTVPIDGRMQVGVALKTSPVYLYLPADTLEIEVRFRRAACKSCTFSFMNPRYDEVAGFVFRGKEYSGYTLVVNR